MSCQSKNHITNTDMDTQKTANRLIHESSPYLLQHAYNPVDWYPWGKEALEKAKKEDKPIIVSIGYSSCHWCHVMEHESFENKEIAQIMNDNYVCIKIDREERPDIDQIYMEAVQLMGQQGGWPLNVFLTPDQKPFYGGTYFPPKGWSNLLVRVAEVYQNQIGEIQQSAEKIKERLNVDELERFQLSSSDDFSTDRFEQMFFNFAPHFDTVDGGMNKAPKFPMPSIYNFLLKYYHFSNDKRALDQITLTLDRMANGGIYDQIGGGFARYSVDGEWFAPHFEKMLYDNGQLLSVYADAYKVTKKESYLKVIEETVSFIERELLDKSNGIYSALDADSEGIEGKFYIWNANHLKELLADDYELFADIYQIKNNGNWEHGENILYRVNDLSQIEEKYELSSEELQRKIDTWKVQLLEEREKKFRPGLDDKVLTSWNALLLKGLCDTYTATENEAYKDLALKNAEFLEKNMLQDNFRLLRRYKDGNAGIDGYLEDYAALISAYISLYQICFDEKWLNIAKSITDYTLRNFYDENEGFFYFTDATSEVLIARKKEIFDNVIPASNSIMATNLYLIGEFFSDEKYMSISRDMLSNINPLLEKDVQYLTNWGSLYALQMKPTTEIVIVGKKYQKVANAFSSQYAPFNIILATEEKSDLPLFQNRSAKEGETTIYICQNKACKIPVHSVEEAFKILEDIQ
ncbi:hypothetical protein BC781_103523 [Sediminitomix flava]|uniref:Spermatogenesis-associated protein 20-like TRX domain-containing protein n=2 Tax=Sediminitomix flava TaxID=379075 RepID=A0A315Z9R9_SEDFL|nr:hypothetical protein BC781_103523 [Sediminitomix flava]